MVCTSSYKRDNTDLTDLLNKILKDKADLDAWIATMRDVAVLDETLDGSLPWYASYISSLPECKGIGPKTLDRIGKEYLGEGKPKPFPNAKALVTRVHGMGTQRYNSAAKAFLPAKPEPVVAPEQLRATFWNLKKLSIGNLHKIKAIVKIMKMHHETDIFFLQEVAGDSGKKAVKHIVTELNEVPGANIWDFRTSGFAEGLGPKEQYAVIWKQTGRLGKKTDDYPRNYLTFQKGVVSTLKQDIKDFLSLSSHDKDVESQNCFDELMEKVEAVENAQLFAEPPSLDQAFKFDYPIWRVSFGDTHYAVHHTSTDSTKNKQELLIMQTLTRRFYELSGTPIYTAGDFNIGEANNLGFAHQHLNMLQLDFPNVKQTVNDIFPHLNNTNWFILKGPGTEFARNPSYNDNVMSGVKCVVTVLPVTDAILAVLFEMLSDIENRPIKPSRAGLAYWIDHKPITLTHELH